MVSGRTRSYEARATFPDWMGNGALSGIGYCVSRAQYPERLSHLIIISCCSMTSSCRELINQYVANEYLNRLWKQWSDAGTTFTKL